MHRMTPCEACGEYSLPILLCADCDRACHAECLPRKQAPSNALVWRCSDCRGERPHDGEMPLVVEARAPPPPRLYVRSPAAPSGKPAKRAPPPPKPKRRAVYDDDDDDDDDDGDDGGGVDDIVCGVCGSGEDDATLLLCDGCDAGCHLACCDPPLSAMPDGDYFCAECTAAAAAAPAAKPAKRPRLTPTTPPTKPTKRAAPATPPNDLAVGARVEVKHGYGGVYYPGRVDEVHRVAGGNTKCVCPCCVSLAARAATENRARARAPPPFFQVYNRMDGRRRRRDVHAERVVNEGPGSVLMMRRIAL